MLLPRDFYRILKNLYLCPDRGLLPAFGLQSTPVSNKTRKSTNISNNLQSRVNPNQEKSGKPKAGINGKDGQPKQGKSRLKGLKGLEIKPFSHCCSDFQ